MDWPNIIITLLSSIIAATIAGIFSTSSMKKQLKQTQIMFEEQKKQLEIEKGKKLIHNRPELEIVSYSPVTKECGYTELDLNTTPHIDVFMCYDTGKSDEEMKKVFERDEWVHCEYALRNIGTQSLYSVEVFSQTTGLYVIDLNEHSTSFPKYLIMNSHAKYQRRRIHKGDMLLLRLWYHKEHVYGDSFCNPITLVLKDFDKNYWEQPINAPYDFLEESKQIPPEERRKLLKKSYNN
ncbi:MAG: hypothetical protein E7666_04690 [Ruminococcaceae bacterium]|nr:hypothetical protein [Oscillospiraceae bacterium]